MVEEGAMEIVIITNYQTFKCYNWYLYNHYSKHNAQKVGSIKEHNRQKFSVAISIVRMFFTSTTHANSSEEGGNLSWPISCKRLHACTPIIMLT